MNKKIIVIIGIAITPLLFAFEWHKFYVSIYQIEYYAPKKRIQITARIFMDDMNTALQKKYNIATHIGQLTETTADFNLMKNYLLEHFLIKINGQTKPIIFWSKEIDTNVLICYLKIENVEKINNIEIQNTALFNISEDQQNIMQVNLFNKKQNLLLTTNNVKGLLKKE